MSIEVTIENNFERAVMVSVETDQVRVSHIERERDVSEESSSGGGANVGVKGAEFGASGHESSKHSERTRLVEDRIWSEIIQAGALRINEHTVGTIDISPRGHRSVLVVGTAGRRRSTSVGH